MTIAEIIDRIDTVKPNTCTEREKILWLNTLDGLIDAEIMQNYENTPKPFIPYTEDDLARELVVPSPYDELYLHYLAMQIDLVNGEYGDYNNDMLLYSESYRAFWKHYHKTHMPKGKKWKLF